MAHEHFGELERRWSALPVLQRARILRIGSLVMRAIVDTVIEANERGVISTDVTRFILQFCLQVASINQVLVCHCRLTITEPAALQNADLVAPVKTREMLKAERGERLSAADQRWGTHVKFGWIHEAADVDHKDAYDWKNGKKPDKSKPSRRIEEVLQRPIPPEKPNYH